MALGVLIVALFPEVVDKFHNSHFGASGAPKALYLFTAQSTADYLGRTAYTKIRSETGMLALRRSVQFCGPPQVLLEQVLRHPKQLR